MTSRGWHPGMAGPEGRGWASEPGGLFGAARRATLAAGSAVDHSLPLVW